LFDRSLFLFVTGNYHGKNAFLSPVSHLQRGGLYSAGAANTHEDLGYA
jgi:hypothetical protein